ncbi:MAG: ABC transporter ATP-binding protein [Geminicoccaceae bacterium]
MSLRLDSVERVVGREVWIEPLTLTLTEGQLYVLLGPTLAGKTSLMRLMAGLDQPTTGRIFADDVDVTGRSVRERSVAMVYQQFINYPTLTAYDNIASPLRLQGIAAAEIDRQVRDTARLLHIDHLLDRLPGALSGGQQQRLAIARALVKRAGLLLLDEPLVNLDYKLREELRSELRDLFARQQTTVVYATTEPLEALIMGGEVIVMDEGRVLQTGPTVQVYHNPASLRVAAVFSDPPMNRLEVTLQNGVARSRGGLTLTMPPHLARLPEGPRTLGVRANHLSIRAQRPSDIKLQAQVELAEISGSETFIHVRNGDLRWVVQEEGVHEHALHQAVEVFVDPSRLFAFDRAGQLERAPERAAAGG